MRIEPFTDSTGEIGFRVIPESGSDRALLESFLKFRPGRRLWMHSSSWDNNGAAGFAFGHIDEKSIAPKPLWRRLLPARWRLA